MTQEPSTTFKLTGVDSSSANKITTQTSILSRSKRDNSVQKKTRLSVADTIRRHLRQNRNVKASDIKRMYPHFNNNTITTQLYKIKKELGI